MLDYFKDLDIILSSSSKNRITLNDILVANYHGDKEFAMSLFFSFTDSPLVDKITNDAIESFIDYMSQNYNDISNIINLKSNNNSIKIYSTCINFIFVLNPISGMSYRMCGTFNIKTKNFSNPHIVLHGRDQLHLKKDGTMNDTIKPEEFMIYLKSAIKRLNRFSESNSEENRFILNKNVKVSDSLSNDESIRYFNIANDFYNKAVKGTKYDNLGKKYFLAIRSYPMYTCMNFGTKFTNGEAMIILRMNIDESYEAEIYLPRFKEKVSSDNYDDKFINDVRTKLEEYQNDQLF